VITGKRMHKIKTQTKFIEEYYRNSIFIPYILIKIKYMLVIRIPTLNIFHCLVQRKMKIKLYNKPINTIS